MKKPKFKPGDIVFQVDKDGVENRFVILEALNKTYRYTPPDTPATSSRI